jgi:hypothetical protein
LLDHLKLAPCNAHDQPKQETVCDADFIGAQLECSIEISPATGALEVIGSCVGEVTKPRLRSESLVHFAPRLVFIGQTGFEKEKPPVAWTGG